MLPFCRRSVVEAAASSSIALPSRDGVGFMQPIRPAALRQRKLKGGRFRINKRQQINRCNQRLREVCRERVGVGEGQCVPRMFGDTRVRPAVLGFCIM